MIWHLLTGEYPPQRGGVSDYTRELACGLAEGPDSVQVWAPLCTDGEGPDPADPGVTIHRLPDRFGVRSLVALTRALGRLPAPRRILVQYVPQAFGCKGGNLLFCAWLRSRRHDSIWVMFHEVLFLAEHKRSVSRHALATVTRWMAALVAGSAERAFISIPGWRPLLQPLLPPGTNLTWLPVPSAIPVLEDRSATAAVRARYGAGHALVGHFGTYGSTVASLLEQTLERLAAMSECHILLMGDHSDAVCRAWIAAHPALTGRLFATGRMSPADVSRHVAACDVMLQPYPDGISSRRTSAMVALSHGRPIVTTTGWLTEPMWADAGAAVLVPADDPAALAAAAATMLFDAARRDQIGRRAAALYDARFDVRHTVRALRALDAIPAVVAVS
jgi:hypothetical protein